MFPCLLASNDDQQRCENNSPLLVRKLNGAMAVALASPSNCVCVLMLPGLHTSWPLSTSPRLTPLSSRPTFSPACPLLSDFLNISTPVTVVFWVGFKPTISISSPGCEVMKTPSLVGELNRATSAVARSTQYACKVCL